jgi:predicted O-methyltransferase YrrM
MANDFSSSFVEVLAAYEEREAREAEIMPTLAEEDIPARRDEFLLAVGRATGQFLNTLVREAKARRVVEVGTSYGYSTLWLAEAVHRYDGRVITLEISPEKSAYAQEQLAQAGLDHRVDFRVGDALDLLDGINGPVDLALIDIWKELYIPCLDRLLPRMAPGGVIVADNILYPPVHLEDGRRYRARVREANNVESVLLPIGSGLEVTRVLSD